MATSPCRAMLAAMVAAALAATANAASTPTAACQCLVFAEASGSCPAKTFDPAYTASGQTLYQDKHGTRRRPTVGPATKCCQYAQAEETKKESCSDSSFACPALSKDTQLGAANADDGRICTSKPAALANDRYVCACATQAEFDEAVDNAIMKAILAAVVFLLVCVFLVVYNSWWFCCPHPAAKHATNNDPNPTADKAYGFNDCCLQPLDKHFGGVCSECATSPCGCCPCCASKKANKPAGRAQPGQQQPAGQAYVAQQPAQYPPQQGAPQYPPQQGAPQYPPQQGAPQYPPQQGAPQYPPQQGAPQYPPQAGQPYPPQAGQQYPPQAGQPYPPQAGQPY